MADSPDLYHRVENLLSREEFEGRVEGEIRSWGGLLTFEAASMLVVDALGRWEVTFGRVADLYDGGEALLDVRVERIASVRTFDRRDGGEGRVVHLTVGDTTGTVRLVLRDDEVDLVTSGTVREGSHIKIVDGTVLKGREGMDVSTGKWGIILPDEPLDASKTPDSQFRF